MDVVKYNREAWDCQDHPESDYYRWTEPVGPEVVAQARAGQWEILLTPCKPVPKNWLGDDLQGKKVLCLASGGGQQGPVLAAAGAEVVVFDNSPKQLEKDQHVAGRDNLAIRTELGDMRDLSRFDDETFDLIVNPASVVFVEELQCVWNEAYRVLKHPGALLCGLINPVSFIFDEQSWCEGTLVPRFKIPYADTRDLPPEELEKSILSQNEPICFGHSLELQIQGQINAGFVIAGFFDDKGSAEDPLSRYMDSFFATRAIKL